MNCFEDIEKTGILPVINVTDLKNAEPLALALKNGGLKTLEITLRSDCSLDVIKTIKSTYKELIVGAGTVLNTDDVKQAIKCGADFIVSPGYDEETVDYCIKNNIAIIPGCSSPSEIQKAIKKGLKVLKYFPAELNGGIDAIKLLSGPFSGVKFIPTGGINFDNLSKYLECDKILACGGSFLAPSKLIEKGQFEEITDLCKKAVSISLGFELAHVGINCNSEDQAISSANELSSIFNMETKINKSSVFTGTAVEFMKNKFYGQNGHIGFKTNSVKRAILYLESKGYEIIKESVKEDAKGLVAAYLKNELCGFAIHVVRK